MQIRQSKSDDYGFIYETFLRSVRAASTHVENLGNSAVVSLLASLVRQGWESRVADAEGYLAGWIVSNADNHLAWIYVRDMFRWSNYKDFPVAEMLLGSANIDTSSRIITPFLPNRSKRKWQFIHRPFLVIE